jgi:prepilin-type N-terminal cleavage/methylation domain-containing protein
VRAGVFLPNARFVCYNAIRLNVFRRRAFTLIELLVVLAIISILAALLYPVFASIKGAAKRSTCLSNFKQVGTATAMYLGDYEEYFMPVNHHPNFPQAARNDRTWVQILLPYVKSFEVFRCPADYSQRPQMESTFDEDLVPGDVYSQYYQASKRVNIGYNYLNLAPIYLVNGAWISEPKSSLSISDSSNTLIFADSVWTRDRSGNPIGGGNWLLVPPCRYRQFNTRVIDTFGGQVFTPFFGWNTADDKAPNYYGNAWPWHDGRINYINLDTSVKSVTPGGLTLGCAVGNRWQGRVQSDSYIWDNW